MNKSAAVVIFVVVSVVLWGLFLGLVSNHSTIEDQTWVKNAREVAELPAHTVALPATYVRNLTDEGAETVLYITNRDTTKPDITIAAKDQGPYWASCQILTPKFSLWAQLNQVTIKDGTLIATIGRSWTLVVLIQLLIFVLCLLLLVSLK